jgi:hypothetical protein
MWIRKISKVLIGLKKTTFLKEAFLWILYTIFVFFSSFSL